MRPLSLLLAAFGLGLATHEAQVSASPRKPNGGTCSGVAAAKREARQRRNIAKRTSGRRAAR